MPKLRVKNLDVTFSEHLSKKQVAEAVERGFAGADPTADTFYIVKIQVGALSVGNLHRAIKGLYQELQNYGITNCMFVPICENGIQNIEVIEVPNEKA